MEAYQRLEQEWAEFNDLDPTGMVACASGTAALHLAFEALRLPAGSEVLCPDYTMVACPRAIAMAGLTPVFVDCGEDLNLDPMLVGRAMDDAWDGNGSARWLPGRRISAVLAVNVYGRAYDVFGVRKATEDYGIKVVEDLAESHGVKPSYNADSACWSFFRNKHVHGEEGGAVWFRDPVLAVLARQLRCLGFTEQHDYDHVPRGMNYRLANTLADLILDSLSKFNSELLIRRAAEKLLEDACPHEWRMPYRDAPWVYDIRITGITKKAQDVIVQTLKNQGIAGRHGFYPMSKQAEFSECRLVGNGLAAKASREVIYVPMSEVSLPAFSSVQEAISSSAKSAY